MTGEASEAIVRGLKSAGVDLVAMLPDHGFDRVQKKIAEDDKFTTEPILRDLQIPYVLVSEVSKVEGAIKDAVASAFAWQNPICLLFRGETLR